MKAPGLRSELRVRFGALVPPLHKQCGVGKPAVAREQRWADEVTSLHLCGLLTEAEAHRARKRIMKKLVRNPAVNRGASAVKVSEVAP